MKWLLIVPAIVLGVILTLFFLIMLLRAGIRLLYSEQALQIWVRLGPVSTHVFPAKKKADKQAGNQNKKSKVQKRQRVSSIADGQKDSSPIFKDINEDLPAQKAIDKPLLQPDRKKQDTDLETICAYVRFGLKAAGQLARGLRVDKLRLNVDVASNDAAKTALAYGGACAAVSSLLPLLESTLNLRKREFIINACFEKNKTELEGEVIITALIGRMVLIGLRVLIEFGKLKKAVSENEQSQ